MSAQHVVVIGEQYLCGEPYCGQPATVILRQFEPGSDTGDVITYCDEHWLSVRRSYTPMVERDVTQAVREAAALVSGGDDDAQRF